MNQQANNSFLHQISNNNNPQKVPMNHGKPNLAPKPPGAIPNAQSTPTKPATAPKRIVINGRIPVTRVQSLRVPRSPPIAPPEKPTFPPPSINGRQEFGSMRNVPSAFHQSQENLTTNKMTHTRNQTLPMNLGKSLAPAPPLMNARPTAPPPVPPPPSRTGSNVNLKAPLSPPPPPPTSAIPPPPPPSLLAPPPPPHRTVPAPPVPSAHGRQPLLVSTRECNLGVNVNRYDSLQHAYDE